MTDLQKDALKVIWRNITKGYFEEDEFITLVDAITSNTTIYQYPITSPTIEPFWKDANIYKNNLNYDPTRVQD